MFLTYPFFLAHGLFTNDAFLPCGFPPNQRWLHLLTFAKVIAELSSIWLPWCCGIAAEGTSKTASFSNHPPTLKCWSLLTDLETPNRLEDITGHGNEMGLCCHSQVRNFTVGHFAELAGYELSNNPDPFIGLVISPTRLLAQLSEISTWVSVASREIHVKSLFFCRFNSHGSWLYKLYQLHPNFRRLQQLHAHLCRQKLPTLPG